MQASFITYLRQQGLSQTETEQISLQAEYLRLPGKHVLVQQGEMERHVYFLLKGLCHASYLTPDGKQFSKEFYWENDFILGYMGLIEQQGSPYRLVSLTPCELLRLPLSLVQQWRRERHPVYLHLLETQLINKEKKERYLLLHNPQERYRYFCQTYPELKARLTDYQIAAYLGISHISLSRIKKRLES